MKSHANEEIADIRDPKWLVVYGKCPVIDNTLIVDVIDNRNNEKTEGLVVSDIYWSRVAKYRLHNGPGYKDGIAIEQPKEMPLDWPADHQFTRMTPEGPQTYTFPTRDGGIASVDLKPGEILVKDTEGYFHVETESGPDDKIGAAPKDYFNGVMTDCTIINEGGSTKYKLVDDHWEIDEHDGIATMTDDDLGRAMIDAGIVEDNEATKYTLQDNGDWLKDEKKPVSTRDKLITILNDNEAMEAIALAACEEQQKVIEAANAYVSDNISYICGTDHFIAKKVINLLSDASMLTLPGESS